MKFAQCHETFRKAEIESIAELEGLDMTIIEYDADVSIPRSDVFRKKKKKEVLMSTSLQFASLSCHRWHVLES